MAQETKSTGRDLEQLERDSKKLKVLLAAMGRTDNNFEDYPLVVKLFGIHAAYSKRVLVPAKPYRKGLKRLLANLEENLEIRPEIRPIAHEVTIAGLTKREPGGDENDLRGLLQNNELPGLIDPAKREAEEIENIKAYLNGSYRKRILRTHVIEPFLSLMEEFNVRPTRTLPRSRMFNALFDWLDVKKPWPAHSGIRSIAHDRERNG